MVRLKFYVALKTLHCTYTHFMIHASNKILTYDTNNETCFYISHTLVHTHMDTHTHTQLMSL